MSGFMGELGEKIGWERQQIRFLVRWLAIPMIVLAVLALLGARATQNEIVQDILLSAATGFLGAILTVFYVEILMERNDRLQWERAADLIEQQVKRLAYPRAVDLLSLQPGFPRTFRRDAYAESMKASLRIDLSSLEDDRLSFEPWLDSLDGSGWQQVDKVLQQIAHDYATLLSLAGPRLSPDAYYLIVRTVALAEGTEAILFQDFADAATAGNAPHRDAGRDFTSSSRQAVRDGLSEFLQNSLALTTMDDAA